MGEKLYDWDPAEGLDTPEAIAVFLSGALETGDSGYIANALGVAARAKGMSDLAQETGLSRSHLYEALSSEGNPTLDTTMRLLKALGVDLEAKAHTEAQAS
jgi:probable addiction module antidote protein